MIELNKIYCENNLDTMARMPDNVIDLTVTSPPYDNLRDYKGYTFEFEKVAQELHRVTKKGGVVVWVVGDATVNGSETGTSFKQALYFKEVGFNLHDTMLYAKENFIPLTHNRYEQQFEYMLVLSKGKPKSFNPILLKTLGAGSVYNLSRKGYSSTIKGAAQRRRNQDVTTKEYKIKPNIFFYTLGYTISGHPAPFPEALPKDMIYSWSNEGDIVYDPFCGSGTTPKMAHLLKRNWIGSEISQEYVDLANKRLDPYLRQTTIF